MTNIKYPNKEAMKQRRTKAEEDIEAALAKQEIVNPVTLEFLRNEIIALEDYIETLQTEAGRHGDIEYWDLARMARGEINMCEKLLRYMKDLTYHESCIQIREGKL